MSSQSRFIDFLKWRWQRLFADVPGPEAYRFPLAANDPAFLRANRSQNTLTWIGHATLLLQVAGKNILTDPHFSQRASPVQWAGPKRVVAPGIVLDELPAIDIVIISHDHYDSLDTQTVLRLAKRPGDGQTRFFVPLGLKHLFTDLGINQVTELAWWESREEAGLAVTAVPAQHWSKRRLFGKDEALWCGWVIAAGDFRFLFVGDSGYAPIFTEIGRRLGPFDMAAIPIGAYEPRWFMKRHHMNPEEAVQVHLDVGARKSVAMHWGTFILTDEPLDEPPKRLMKAMADKHPEPGSFLVLQHGETIFLEAAGTGSD